MNRMKFYHAAGEVVFHHDLKVPDTGGLVSVPLLVLEQTTLQDAPGWAGTGPVSAYRLRDPDGNEFVAWDRFIHTRRHQQFLFDDLFRWEAATNRNLPFFALSLREPYSGQDA